MSYNLAFMYVRTVLDERGPLTGDEIAGILTQFSPGQIREILASGVDNGSLTDGDGRYALTERGAR